MSYTQKDLQLIWGKLVISRNILSNGRSTDDMVSSLEALEHALGAVTIASTRHILRIATSKAIGEIIEARYVSAGFILNLVHNLPLDEEHAQSWDIDYFFSTELSRFLGHFDEIVPARTIVLFVMREIALQYPVAPLPENDVS